MKYSIKDYCIRKNLEKTALRNLDMMQCELNHMSQKLDSKDNELKKAKCLIMKLIKEKSDLQKIVYGIQEREETLKEIKSKMSFGM